MMKLFIKTTCIALLLILSTQLFAQKKDSVEVSPNLTQKTILKKCKELDLGKIVFNEKPIYPEDAKSARVGGTVKVDVKVDEKGNVIEVLETNGHQLLKAAANNAARKSKFTPTICDGQVAQVNAVMIYNFIPYVITDNYFIPKSIEDFLDITSDSAYYESILFLTENYNLTFGYGDKNFHPNAPLTKGDFVHFLSLTLDLLEKRAKLANKKPEEISLYTTYNPQKISSTNSIKDFKSRFPYSASMQNLLAKYNIVLVDEKKRLNGKFPVTQNEVIDYWTSIFGKDAVPLHFKKIETGDKIFTRGDFSLFLQESMYVLTYKVLP